MLFPIILILLALYLQWLVGYKRLKFGNKVMKGIRVIIITSILFLLIIHYAANNSIFLRSYWISRGFFWALIVSSILAVSFIRKDVLSFWEQVIYTNLALSPIIIGVLIFIPFLGIGIALKVYQYGIGAPEMILYEDDKIRVELPYIRLSGPDPTPEIYAKHTITAFRAVNLPHSFNENHDSLEVRRLNDSSYRFIQYSPDNYLMPNGSDTFYFELRQDAKSVPKVPIGSFSSVKPE